MTTTATFSGTGAVTPKTSDTATLSGYNCVFNTSSQIRTKEQATIQTEVTVTGTDALISAWETNLTNLGHKGSGVFNLKDNTTNAYFARNELNYVAKSAVSTSTSLGQVTTALTGHLSLAGSVLASAAALYTALAF